MPLHYPPIAAKGAWVLNLRADLKRVLGEFLSNTIRLSKGQTTTYPPFCPILPLNMDYWHTLLILITAKNFHLWYPIFRNSIIISLWGLERQKYEHVSSDLSIHVRTRAQLYMTILTLGRRRQKGPLLASQSVWIGHKKIKWRVT